MGAMAKSQMLVAILAGHIETVRVGKDRRVPIGSRIPKDNLLVPGDALTVELGVFHGRATHVLNRRNHAQGFIGHRRDQGRV